MLKIMILISVIIPIAPVFSQSDTIRNIMPIDGYTGPSEKMPEFIGGQEAMYKFIYDRLEYPMRARKKNIQGTVVVEFTVYVDSLVRKIHVLRSIGGGCDEEAVRVMSLMSTQKLWLPGRHEYKAVPVSFTMPFKFKLTESLRKSGKL